MEGEHHFGRDVELAREVIDALVSTGLVVGEALGSLIEDLAPDAFPGESRAEVLLEMAAGSCAPVARAAGEPLCSRIARSTSRRVSGSAQILDWLSPPAAVQLEPTARHAEVLRGLLLDSGTAGNLTTDAHLAALAVEHGGRVVSYDRDFGRFTGVPHQLPA